MISHHVHDSGLAELRLERPEIHNATSTGLLDAMDAGLDAIEADARARVLMLAGAGRSFCSGLDLDEVLAGPESVHRLLRRLSEVMRRLRRTRLVTIAAVQGAAIGGGFGFMCACDFAVTHAESRIGYPPGTIGLSGALMAPWLVRKIGASAARAMLLAGGTIDGAAAHARGLATHLVSRDGIDGAVRAIGADLLAAPDHAICAMKGFLNDLDGSSVDEDLDRAALVSAEVIAHPETQRRVRQILRRDDA